MAQKGQAGRSPLGRPAWCCHPRVTAFFADGSDLLKKLVAVALVRSEVVGGRAAWPRPAGLGLSPLGPPFHRRVNQCLYFPPQFGLGLGSEFGHCRWTQLVMAQAFRSWFMHFV